MLNNLSPVGVLDLGSYQSKFIIFKITNSKIEILSKIILKTQGVKKGFISDIEKLANLINELIGKAEDSANLKIKDVYLSISPLNSFFISFCNSKNIGGYEIEHENDVQFLINDAVNLFQDNYAHSNIIHLFNFNFRTDKTNFVENPVGLVADSFESDINIVCTKNNIIKNFIKIFNNINLKLEKFIFAPYVLGLLANLESPLSDSIMILDFGHEKTSLSIFRGQNYLFTTTVPLGSWHVTNDIAKSLNLSLDIAENLKHNHSSCKIIGDDQIQQYIESENLGSKSYKKVSNNILNRIVNSRVEEIIDFLNNEISYFIKNKMNFNKIVVTGEGSKIRGFYELLKQKLLINGLVVEKFSTKIKNNIDDEFDVCLSMISHIQNFYAKEIPSNSKVQKSIFKKLYSIFN